jgi:hypothetical protein
MKDCFRKEKNNKLNCFSFSFCCSIELREEKKKNAHMRAFGPSDVQQ